MTGRVGGRMGGGRECRLMGCRADKERFGAGRQRWVRLVGGGGRWITV